MIDLKYSKSIIFLNSYEKLCLFNHINLDSCISLRKIVITFLLKNTVSNRDLFLCNQLLLERLLFQRGKFMTAKKNIPSFNVKKQTRFGYQFILRNSNLHFFLVNLIVYSINRVFLVGLICSGKNYKKHGYYNQIVRYRLISVVLKKLLFFGLFNTISDWEDYSYIYDELIYGINLSFFTDYSNVYINRIITSQYGINFI